jgi:phosphohistidine phosphatase
MDLVLWRHADAEAGVPDHARRLTAKGMKQAARVGAWLDRHLPQSAKILVSPAERAQQTAQGLGRRFTTVRELGPGAAAEDVLDAAGWPRGRETVVLVGHQPTLGEIAALLLSGREAGWSIKKGAVCWLSTRDGEGGNPVAVTLRVAIGPDFV